jgi:hypothetical protein
MIGAVIKGFLTIAFAVVFPIVTIIILGLVVFFTVASEGGGFE